MNELQKKLAKRRELLGEELPVATPPSTSSSSSSSSKKGNQPNLVGLNIKVDSPIPAAPRALPPRPVPPRPLTPSVSVAVSSPTSSATVPPTSISQKLSDIATISGVDSLSSIDAHVNIFLFFFSLSISLF